MATLFNTKISQTYQGLLKTIDNAVLSATLRELTDGSGNQSGLFLNTAGDFKVSAILEWGSLKDTGTGVTITQFVTAANGIQNFNNDTTVPTSAAVKLYVDTKFSQTDTLQEVLTFGNTTSGTDIAVSANDDITFTDSSKILMGASSDLQIYHDGSNSYIKDAGSGGLRIASDLFRVYKADLSGLMINAVPDDRVELYFNDNKKLATTNTGVDVTGNLVVSGTITGSGGSFLPLAGGTMTGNIVLNDNVKSIYGTSNDGLEIYHDGSNSLIADTGTGLLNIRSNQVKVTNAAGNETMIKASEGASVQLYFDNNQKLETTSTGVTVTGALSTTTNVTVGANATFIDNGKALFGGGSDLRIYHDGTDSLIRNYTGNLYIGNKSDDKDIIFQSDNGSGGDATYLRIDGSTGEVLIGHYASTKITTKTDGALITGNLEVTGTITGSGGSFLPLAGGTMTGNTIHNDNVKSIYGTASDGLEIYHDGTHSYLEDTGTGDLRIKTNGAALALLAPSNEDMILAVPNSFVKLYFNNSEKLATTNTGISVTGNVVPTANVHIQDAGQLQLGTGINGKIYHDGNNFIANNLTGDLYIDQAAVTKSIFFRVSNANALDTTALTINREGDLTTGADVTIAGNLTVNGTTTTINTQTLAVEDPLIELAKDNAANSVDIGFYGKYNDGTARYLGLFSDASDSNKFRLFKGTTVQPTTTVNIAGSGYVAADLELANLTGNGTILLQGSATQTIRLIDNTQGVTLSSFAQDANAGFGTFSSHSLNLYSNSSVSLTLDASQNASFTGDVSLADSKQLKLGNGADLLIFHDGANSYIKDTGTGNLEIRSNFLKVKSPTAEDMIWAQENAGVTLFYNNVSKLTTTSTGIQISDSGTVKKIVSYFDGDYTSGFKFSDLNGGIWYDAGADDLYLNANHANSQVILQSGGSTTLTLDASNNSTFAGDVIVNGGNLGVGMTPTEVLDIKTTSGDCRMRLDAPSGSDTEVKFFNDGAAQYTIGHDDDSDEFRIALANVEAPIMTFSKSSVATIGVLSNNQTGRLIVNNEGGSATTASFNSRTNRSTVSISDNDTSGYLSSENGVFSIGRNAGVNANNINIDAANNVGIGTNSPGNYRLNVSKGAVGDVAQITDGVANTFIIRTDANTLYTGNANNLPIAFLTNNTERMRIDSSGRVGIGADPADWAVGTGGGSLRIGSNGHIQDDSNSTYYAHNLYYNAGWKFLDSNAHKANYILMADDGSMQFSNTTNTGTAGQAATVVERMRINGTGQVVIGNDPTPVPDSILTLRTSASTGLSIKSASNSGESFINFGDNDDVNAGRIYYGHTDNAMRFRTNDALRMLINSSGDVGIGTDSPRADSFTRGLTIGNTSDGGAQLVLQENTLTGGWRIFNNGYLGFIANNDERMRITSGGDVLINTAIPNVYLNTTANQGGVSIMKDSAGSRLDVARDGSCYTANRPSTTGIIHDFRQAGVPVGSITITTSSTAYNTSSDYRLKEDLQDFAGLDMVSKIPVYDFKWKTDESRSYGVMAHELQEVLPQAVVGEKDAEEMQSVDYSKIVPLLVKSIQELTAKVEKLESTLTKCKCNWKY